ncbi:MAG: NADH-quinone oxidoreductase subunit N [Deltaproteobacteria bacterium]|nr:NADH-quinone oxidoreductase subunit N [Deltaproteobacteria bacterium]
MDLTFIQLASLLPLGVLLVTALLLLMLEVFSVGLERGWAAVVAVGGLGLALYFTVGMISEPPVSLFATTTRPAPVLVDAFSSFASSVMIAGAIVAALLSPAYVKNAGCNHAEYYALMIFAVVGMMLMAMAGDLFTLFLGLETMSIAVYVLTGIRKNDPRAAEAAMKYFLMGAFATGFLLFGIALLYGALGSTALPALARAVKADQVGEPIFALGLILLVIGIGFKIAAVPFHLWAPDVYEGAPTPVTGFMAVGVKAAAFVGLIRIVVAGMGGDAAASPVLIPALSVLAYLTIIVGNILAVMQRNVKRMLAYSSISHAGYALIGVVAVARGEESAGAAVLFYLLAYTFMTLGAFGVLTYLERKDGGAEAERFGAYAGMGFRHPALGAAMALFMIALAGMPPTGGFFGKLYIFGAALKAGELGLVVVGIVGSMISIYYYLRVIVAFYMRDVPDPGPLPLATASRFATIGLALSVAAVIYLGVLPSHWIELGRVAIRSLRAG